MLRNLHGRQKPRYGTHICALIAALLLLLSVSLLHSRLGSERVSRRRYQVISANDVVSDTLLEDVDLEDVHSSNISDDRIDELDDIPEESDQSGISDEEGGVESEEEEGDQSRVSGYNFDHVNGVIRRAFDKRSIDQWVDYESFNASVGSSEDQSKVAFGSDDVPVDEDVRSKVVEVSGIEDALLLKIGSRISPLREGWGPWFDTKSDFFRRDRMFKSNLEVLNPMNNPLLQDPDGSGITGLTRGDRLVRKGLLNEFKKVPFLVKKPQGIEDSTPEANVKSKHKFNKEDPIAKEIESFPEGMSETKRAERRTLDDDSVRVLW